MDALASAGTEDSHTSMAVAVDPPLDRDRAGTFPVTARVVS